MLKTQVSNSCYYKNVLAKALVLFSARAYPSVDATDTQNVCIPEGGTVMIYYARLRFMRRRCTGACSNYYVPVNSLFLVKAKR